jgi:hypothetical protein
MQRCTPATMRLGSRRQNDKTISFVCGVDNAAHV